MPSGSEPLLIKKQFREDLEDLTRINPYKTRTWTKDVYDRENNSYCGRTPRRWWYLLLGYTVLWGICTLLVAICFTTFYYNLSMDIPRWFAHQPTFSITPCDDKSTKYCEIYYEVSKKNFENYVKANTQFLQKYGEINPLKQDFGSCNRDNFYGFREKTPCIFLKINRVIGYKAEVYERDKELPNYAPQELREYLNSLEIKERLNRVWISCEANKNIDITYFPKRYIEADLLDVPKKIIKTKNVENEEKQFYAEEDFGRIIAVQLSNLPADEVQIVCYFWAKNIIIAKEREHGAGKVVIKIKVLN